ncbi:hypothetical protein PENNAL_c0041G06516 [Penicillium nalgiovense]|uniref:Uncharacterized protein n=1 Tax=Penicillium nalgiovense TaxID=60175 RepID=A0A1V6Y1Z9_PENNA|nr:hypothetical protein PENNAL_c0041G06516 [Penicillium nalgiovense]
MLHTTNMDTTAPTPRPRVDASSGNVTRSRRAKLTSQFQYGLHSPHVESSTIHFYSTVSVNSSQPERRFQLGSPCASQHVDETPGLLTPSEFTCSSLIRMIRERLAKSGTPVEPFTLSPYRRRDIRDNDMAYWVHSVTLSTPVLRSWGL